MPSEEDGASQDWGLMELLDPGAKPVGENLARQCARSWLLLHLGYNECNADGSFSWPSAVAVI
jgi:hypothetical protein